MHRPSILLASLALLAFSSCSSTGKSGGDSGSGAAPAEIHFREHRGDGILLGLINEGHTERVDFYSTVRDWGNTKVASDEVMEELLSFLQENDFFKYAGANSANGPTVIQSLELLQDGEPVRMLNRKDAPDAERDAFRLCLSGFLQIYDGIYAAQSVFNPDGSKVQFNSPGLPR